MSSAARVQTPFPRPAGDTGPGDTGTGRRSLRARFHRDSPLWLVVVAALFLLAEFNPILLRMRLGADEITYIAQTSVHASQIILPPVHARGAGVLAAPVTLLTTSVLALRLWMAVLSAIGLFLALLAWRGLRPAWVLAVAGLLLGSLAISQLSGVQAMPDWWVALGALAVTGLFIQAVTGRMRDRLVLPLLAATTFFLILLRPQDSAFLLAGIIVTALIVPGWRNRRVLAAIGIGIVAGAVEWLGEAYAWYGGPVSRLHMMRQEPPKFALYFSLPYQLRVLNGPWYCRPGQCHSWDYPALTGWWLVLLGLVVLGIFATRRVALASSMVAVVAALSVLAAYTLVRALRGPALPAPGDRAADDPGRRRDRLARDRAELAGRGRGRDLRVPAGRRGLPAVRAAHRGQGPVRRAGLLHPARPSASRAGRPAALRHLVPVHGLLPGLPGSLDRPADERGAGADARRRGVMAPGVRYRPGRIRQKVTPVPR